MKKGQTNNPHGRPPIDEEEKRKMVSLRLKPRTVEWLKAKAKEKGISQAAVIDEMVCIFSNPKQLKE